MPLTRTFKKAMLSGIAACSFFAVSGADKAMAHGGHDRWAPKKHKNLSGKDTITHCTPDNHLPGKQIYNTPGETALLESIFGKSLDNSKAVKYFTGIGAAYESAAGVACNEWATEYIGTDAQSKDFSKELDINKYKVFVHENTHRWQFQHREYYIICKEDPSDDSKEKYKYKLTKTSKFKDFCIEQQADIVAHYAIRFLHKFHSAVGTREDHENLARVVEEQFPEAKKARLAALAQGIKSGHIPSNQDADGTCVSAPAKGTPLTKGEAEMARGIFGQDFDTSNIRKYYLPEDFNHPAEIACRDKKSLEFYGKSYHVADHSLKDEFGVNGIIFIRQITRLWQMRNGITADNQPENDYTAIPGAKFTDYGIKSQASLITDYKARFLDSTHRPPLMMNAKGYDEEWLKNVVEAQFPEAKKTRLAVEAKERLSPPKKPAYSRPCLAENHTPGKGMPLTKGEHAMVRGIFGHDFDTADIRKYHLPDAKGAHIPEIACNDKKSLEFYGQSYHAADYSLAHTPEQAAHGLFFMRQMTYLWQMRNNIAMDDDRNSYQTSGTYTVKQNARFTDYNAKRQAALITDYRRSFLDTKRWPTLFMNAQGADIEWLKNIVEEQFPEAKKTRLAHEAHQRAAKTPKP